MTQAAHTEDSSQFTPQETPPEIVAEARENGWTEQETYKGDPSSWLDAEAFVKKGRQITPLLKKNNERLLRELADNKAELNELKLTVKEFGELYGKMSESAYKRAINDVKSQLKEARRSDDDTLVDQLETQLDDLKESAKNIQVPQVRQPTQTNGSAIFREWVAENPWFDESKEPALFHATDSLGGKLAKERPDLAGTRAFLDLLKERATALFPDKFRKAQAPSMVESSSSTRSASATGGKKSYAALPAEAKDACDRMTTPGRPGYIPGFTRESYITTYFGD